MDDLEVDSELATAVANDEHANAATAGLKSRLETVPEVRLLENGQVLLDVTSLGHGDDGAVLDVQDTVLLEDGAPHGLDDDARGGMADGGRLLVQLLGEEVDTEIAVLAGGGRGRDADNLAGTALQDQDVAMTDVVAWDRDGVDRHLLATGGVGVPRYYTGVVSLNDFDMLATFWMKQTVSELVSTMAE